MCIMNNSLFKQTNRAATFWGKRDVSQPDPTCDFYYPQKIKYAGRENHESHIATDATNVQQNTC